MIIHADKVRSQIARREAATLRISNKLNLERIQKAATSGAFDLLLAVHGPERRFLEDLGYIVGSQYVNWANGGYRGTHPLKPGTAYGYAIRRISIEIAPHASACNMILLMGDQLDVSTLQLELPKGSLARYFVSLGYTATGDSISL